MSVITLYNKCWNYSHTNEILKVKRRDESFLLFNFLMDFLFLNSHYSAWKLVINRRNLDRVLL